MIWAIVSMTGLMMLTSLAVDLARVQTMGKFATPVTFSNGQTATHWQLAVYTFIRDGAVMVDCHTNPVDPVWFVLP